MSEKLEFLKKLKVRLAGIEKDSLFQKLLDASEDKLFLEETLQNLDEGVVLLNPKGVPFFINARAETWLGISSRNVLKQPFWNSVEDGPLADFLKKQSADIKTHTVIRFRLLSPREMDLRVTLVPTERRKGTLLILTDITNRTEQEFETAMIQRMESLVRLAGGIAHEIGNPLNSIMIHLELLRKKLKGLPDAKKKEIDSSLGDIQAETKRLDHIIRNFLKATRKPPLRFRMDNINESVADAVNFLKPELDAANIKVRLTRDTTIPAFLLDRDRLYYAFINLLKNAMDAMPKGGEVKITTAHKANCAVVTVSDTGCGIAEEDLPHIFDIYYTTKKEGAGLGLMMVYDAVKEHGGKIEVTSKTGKGATFKILLPVREPQLQLPVYAIKGGLT